MRYDEFFWSRNKHWDWLWLNIVSLLLKCLWQFKHLTKLKLLILLYCEFFVIPCLPKILYQRSLKWEVYQPLSNQSLSKPKIRGHKMKTFAISLLQLIQQSLLQVAKQLSMAHHEIKLHTLLHLLPRFWNQFEISINLI